MKKTLIKAYFYLGLVGIDIRKLFFFVKGTGFYFSDLKQLKKQLQGNKDFPLGKRYPVLFDKFDESGVMTGHYFHADLLVARKVFKNKPLKHIDIGSRIDGLVAHIACFREIEIFDIRPLKSTTENITFKQADLMQLPDDLLDYCDSASSIHALEHFGLGRYGDPIDVDGHLKAIENIRLMLKPKGIFFFASPIGPQRIEFNAHRVFSIQYLLNTFKDKFNVLSFSYVNDNGDLLENVALDEEGIKSNFNCNYGCGIFELSKI